MKKARNLFWICGSYSMGTYSPLICHNYINSDKTDKDQCSLVTSYTPSPYLSPNNGRTLSFTCAVLIWGKYKNAAISHTTFLNAFFNGIMWISLKISPPVVRKVPINNIPALTQVMAWCRLCDNPISLLKMVCLLTRKCVIWLQWIINTQSKNEPGAYMIYKY